MDPTGLGASATIGTLLTIAAGIMAYMRYKRGKREKVAQDEADAMGASIKRADTGSDAPLTGLRLGQQDDRERGGH